MINVSLHLTILLIWNSNRINQPPTELEFNVTVKIIISINHLILTSAQITHGTTPSPILVTNIQIISLEEPPLDRTPDPYHYPKNFIDERSFNPISRHQLLPVYTKN